MAYVGHVKAIDNRLERVSAAISLKAPGNEAKRYPLTFQQSKDKGSDFYLEASEKIPLTIFQTMEEKSDKLQITVCITALEDTYFSYSQQFSMIIVSSICRDSGIVVIYVHLRKLLHFIRQIAGLFARIG